jgi:hypothetical protein
MLVRFSPLSGRSAAINIAAFLMATLLIHAAAVPANPPAADDVVTLIYCRVGR